MTKKEIERYLSQLKNGNITRRKIPYVVLSDEKFIVAERQAKTRFWDRRGYDVINNNFFVIEKMLVDFNEDRYTETAHRFETFEEFYDFLDGDIYDNSSYYQLTLSKEIINKYNLDVGRLKNTHFIDYTVDSFKIEEFYREKFAFEDNAYNEAEKTKKNLLKWVDRLCDCETLEKFADVYKKFKKSKYKEYDKEVNALVIQKKPDTIFEYLISTYNYSEFYEISDLESLFGHYNINKINDAVIFDKSNFYFTANTFAKRKRLFKALVDKLSSLEDEDENLVKEDNTDFYGPRIYARFSPDTHFYTVAKRITYTKNEDWIHIFDVFVSFEEFADFLNRDLSGCDLTEAKLQHIDFGNYITDINTKLPKSAFDLDTVTADKFKYEINKKYDKDYFSVSESWEGLDITHQERHSFEYFGDLVYFLKGNLSNADFSLCPNLMNLQDIAGLDFSDAFLLSNFCDKFGIQYAKINLPSMTEYSFALTNKYEEETGIILSNKSELDLSPDERTDYIEIAYISDLHLLHMFYNRGCKSEADCDCLINEVVRSLSRFMGYLVIGGDIASDFSVFERFLKRLSNIVPCYSKSNVIFVLGNHELWGLEGMSLADIINKYRITIEKYGFRFLQNSIFYKSINSGENEIDEATLMEISETELREQLKDARLIIYGGIGFSGLNEEFNANHGVYRTLISRQEEKLESYKFEKIYEKVCDASKGRNLVVLSHMPRKDWTHSNYRRDVVYVNGHSHRNDFRDEDGIRVYADNQIGYRSPKPFLKSFYIDREFDWFSDYDDDIYEITIEQYRDFYRAKNILMNCNREGQYYMLKKNSYYCFLFFGRDNFTKRTGLFLLNGGQLSAILNNDIEYYYKHMDEVISLARKPLDIFTSIQNKIADQVKAIGGQGRIHGAIIDIDFYNHIYVNPNPDDLKITAYWAANMVAKKVYKNVPSLLKAECPTLYGNYVKLIERSKDNALVVKKNTEIDLVPKPYYDTCIYKASRVIKKMQRVNKGILATWPDDLGNSQTLLIEK